MNILLHTYLSIYLSIYLSSMYLLSIYLYIYIYLSIYSRLPPGCVLANRLSAADKKVLVIEVRASSQASLSVPRKGTDGVSTDGVTANLLFFDGNFLGTRVNLLLKFPKVPGRIFYPNLSKFITCAAAPLVLTRLLLRLLLSL